MDKRSAKLLVEAIVDRIYREPAMGKLRLEGPIAEIEFEALKYALAELALGQETSVEGPAPSASVPVPGPTVPPAVRAPLVPRFTPDRAAIAQDDLILCLDFGTAMSKAYATRHVQGRVVDVPVLLGQAAGEPSPFLLSSSVWIADNGEVLVGRKAVERSIAGERANRKRVDSLKQQLSQGAVESLDGALLDKQRNPTSVPIHYGDLISFYLGYLTDLAESELERLGHSRFVRRRFALPCWPEPRATQGQAHIRSHLARAQILADTFCGRWNGGITVNELRDVIDALNGRKNEWPLALVGEGVLEPVAAGASRLESEEEFGRHLVMVVDVGAGTTDYALFVARETPEGAMKFFQLADCADALRQAGDTIDDHLRQLILRKASIEKGSSDFEWVNDALQQDIRTYKETLFQQKRLRYVLSNDRSGEITLDELLADAGVRDFGEQLRSKFQEVLDRGRAAVAASRYSSLKVVLTGGGAQLPMVQALASGQSNCGGIPLRHETAAPFPPSWQDRAADVRRIYPQLAVAIGGAQPNLVPVSSPMMPKGRTDQTVVRIPGFGG